jgi:hypothetical protein
MTVLRRGDKTAEELLAELEKDPEWVARRDAREAEQRAKEERSIAEQALLLADLRRVGCRIRWIWDFVNSAESYPKAIPILIDHLRRPYKDATREGIARALAVREARGLAGETIIEVLQQEGLGKQLRWALANSLTVVADRTNRDAIKAILATEEDKDVAGRLSRALKTAAKP